MPTSRIPRGASRFLAKWRQGYEVVYAIRRKRKEGVLLRACYALFYRAWGVWPTSPSPTTRGTSA
jgi:dolichol-phosphate mannosyltransferase